MRELHDLTAGLVDGAECVIHDDLQPRNVVVDGRRPIGLIDWEQARPGRRVEDVANLCWSFVEPTRGSSPEEVGARWRHIVVTYGLDDPAELLPAVTQRMAVCIDDIERHATAGSARHRALADRGDHVAIRAMLDWTAGHAADLDRIVTDTD